MAYNVKVTASAQKDLDSIIAYSVQELTSPQAAGHLPDKITEMYRILADNPMLFSKCTQPLLRKYRKAVVMRYVIIYRVEDDTVYVERFFSQLEDYANKL